MSPYGQSNPFEAWANPFEASGSLGARRVHEGRRALIRPGESLRPRELFCGRLL